jgi:hypothetical protein
LNNFRKNPKELAKKLELIRTYLDPESNILSEPNKIQIQMVEGDAVFKEAIQFLKSLPSLPPLQWDPNLCQSALEHVNDIGPKGLLLYQSSDGTEPEDRIAKYGNFTEPIGENIDFGPNDAMGVIVSLTLDDGEEQRPHRENLFKDDYKKVGIACGPHETEFQMCVMDFALDFQPLNNQRNNNMRQAEMNAQMNRDNMMNNQNVATKGVEKDINNQSPVVKLSIEKEDMKNNIDIQRQNNEENMNNINQQLIQQKPKDEIGQVINDTINTLSNTKVIKKKVEIITTITYTYEDGSTKVITQNQSHEFNN